VRNFVNPFAVFDRVANSGQVGHERHSLRAVESFRMSLPAVVKYFKANGNAGGGRMSFM
jgi:hypothetical protein